MFVIVLTYTAPLEEIDALMADHVRFLEAGFRSGVFLVGGRQVPRTGGILLARAVSRESVDQLMQQDPFVAQGAATYEIIEFRSSLHQPALASFADDGTRQVK